MLVPALQAFLATFLALGINWYVGQCMSERPIVAGLIAGIIFGDIPAGVMIGCALEAIFMGAVNVGGAVSAEPVTATVVTVAFVVATGMNQGVAITAVGTPLGLVAGIIYLMLFNVFMSLFAPAVDWAARTGNGSEKRLLMVRWIGWFVKYFLLAIPSFLAVYIGAEPVAALASQIPENVIAGFTTCGNLLPAVGMALLLKMLWDKKLAVYYLLGFVLVIYLNLPMVAVAALGAVIVVVTALRDMEILDLKKHGITASSSSAEEEEEEDFFA
ncbi:PTS mannose/fructose/sorbose/N-acetylgalactosamine transporter subunit IIC [Parolsenella catena]|uniref:PTS mannose/fructose/sorbose/N-acetylgalactosamine transporter subunit IIC n=1 Tax=Parolsenella catena TaxID=2003188 RepID=UPI0018999F76|nr:PTS sugar transporter subunit IIC [Parolsenella catena]